MLYASYADIQKYSVVTDAYCDISMLQLSYRKRVSGYGCYYKEANAFPLLRTPYHDNGA